MKNVCIIGSGSWGCALAIHAAKIGHNVKIWSFAQKEADLINKERTYLCIGFFYIVSVLVTKL